VEKAESYGKYKYELSIIVLAYNKLEYTKMCCESILANVPSGLNYELILLNHGSTDGTKEYFERLNPTKQLDFKLNGTELLSVYMRVIEGKYYLHISNDVIVTFNAISNMLITMRDDEKAGGKLAQIVPSTPNVSNLQTITCNYDTLESMHKFAKDNNIYDQFRHEVRTRLCNPIHMVRSRCQWFPYNSPCGLPPISSGQFSFPDDFQSMLFRRAGYRNILAKDAYCYHYGSVTIKDEVKDRQIDANAMYRKGRVTFEEIYGIDPWGTGFCYDPYWVAAVKCEFEGHIEILGVNCGHGSNSLKVKELYKELRHNLNVTLTNVTSDTRYIEDLRGVSDSARIVKTIDEIFEVVKQYHHIVIDDSFYGSVHNLDDLELFYRRLVRGGTMYVNYGAEREPIFKARFPKVEFAGNWAVLSYD
jgi:glycosyltransferase involved in cell wall biosynthesis